MFKKIRSNSTSQARTTDNRVGNSRRYSTPNPTPVNYEILHAGHNQAVQDDVDDDDDDLSPLATTQSNKSAALSEAETLYTDRHQRLELQDSYIDNFTMYLPFVIRQMRLLETRRYYENDHPLSNGTTESSTDSHSESEPSHIIVPMDDSFDDTSTIFEEGHIPVEAYAATYFKILEKGLTDFSIKRLFILVGGMLKHNMYIFPSEGSFELFRSLRLNIKKERKNLIVVYDKRGAIKRVSSSTKREDLTSTDDIVIDDRPHIVPLDQKLKGLGLPLFKVLVPYLSSFRKNTPLIIFKKFKELPAAPDPNAQDDTEFETFNFCMVYSKYFQPYRRFIFEFHPEDQPSFKIVMFQSNFRPFADFNYKNTRFRVIGPSILLGVVQHYNPHMRLLVIDENKPSLADDVVNKKQSTGFIKRKSSEAYVQFDENNPDTYINPIPNNSFANEINSSLLPQPLFISNDLPPFGSFKDSILYQNPQLLPKKYSEVGKIQIYQDKETLQGKDLDSTLSVDLDSLVLLCVMNTLRDVSIRNSGRTHSPGALAFPGPLGRLTYGFDPPNPGVFGL
ncbi:hypothetical protein Cantr_02549 [Candida viswanathii]|uniref:Uncharacterized protein n=1 Tax=Candida viswanathii TaxID=5486 RepID=A0A367YNQ5_9ASCO|nr:hypothetical protein Cantr_02549 [Candida viswanathii]